jgi:hypothetical protein
MATRGTATPVSSQCCTHARRAGTVTARVPTSTTVQLYELVQSYSCTVLSPQPIFACKNVPAAREPISRISIHPRPRAVRLGTGVNRSTPGPLVTPGPRGGFPGVRGRRRGLAGTYPRCWGSAGAAGAGPEPTPGSRLLRVWRACCLLENTHGIDHLPHCPNDTLGNPR